MSHKATNWAFDLRGLTPGQKVVLLHLADCHSVDNGCYPSQEWLASACEISERTLREYLNALENLGLIIRERKVGNQGQRIGTRYYFAFEVAASPLPAEDAGRADAPASLPADGGAYRQTSAEPTGNCLPVITSNYNNNTAPARARMDSQASEAFIERVKAAVGDALADPVSAPNLMVTGPLLALLHTDPPCTEEDVIDAAKYIGAYCLSRYGPRSLKSWRRLIEKAIECREDRRGGYGIPKEQPKPKGDTLGDPALFDRDMWRRVINLANMRGWQEPAWGAPPGRDGCLVPKDLWNLWKGSAA